MNRRAFLSGLLASASVFVMSRLPWSGYGAVFRVTRVDPDGSGMDYSGHLGAYVYNAKRCCRNCSLIFASFTSDSPSDVDNGPGFCHDELTAVNRAAQRLTAEIEASLRFRAGRSNYEIELAG